MPPIHRHALVAVGHELLHHGRDRLVAVDPVHAGARHHDLDHLGGAGLQQVVDQRPLGGRQVASHHAFVEQRAKLVDLQDVGGGRLLADNTRGQPVGDKAHRRYQRADQVDPEMHGFRDDTRADTRRVGNGDGLGRGLTEQQ